MDGGEQESARDPRKCRGHWVTRRPVSYGQPGRGVRPGGRAEAGQRLGHRGDVWK